MQKAKLCLTGTTLTVAVAPSKPPYRSAEKEELTLFFFFFPVRSSIGSQRYPSCQSCLGALPRSELARSLLIFPDGFAIGDAL